MNGSVQDAAQAACGSGADSIPLSNSVNSISEEIQVDPDGDLVLRAGQQMEEPQKSFRVCASALRRSSQVWKKMLFGPFKESKPAFGTWLVNLPDDDAEALGILLNIIHANFPLVPTTPSLAALYEIFRMANKYDMIPALKPWANAWLDVAESYATAADGRSMAALTYVAWELGQVELHRKTMKELLLYSTVDKDGRMVTVDGVVLDDFDPIGPPGLLDNS
ncbi:BTB homology protein [Colletotrichum incanum]|nr:BTB homology protein [Colletotrichum incanum]